jgi:hypothetical protein
MNQESEPETDIRRLYARHAKPFSGLAIWAEDVFVSRPDGDRRTAKWLRLMPISAVFDWFKIMVTAHCSAC